MSEKPRIDQAVHVYIENIVPEYRPLFDRIHRLVMSEFPQSALTLAYKMPTFKVADRHLYVGVWKHGLSIYGWQQGREAAFIARHPDLKTSRGTIRLGPEDAAGITDTELQDLIHAALDS